MSRILVPDPDHRFAPPRFMQDPRVPDRAHLERLTLQHGNRLETQRGVAVILNQDVQLFVAAQRCLSRRVQGSDVHLNLCRRIGEAPGTVQANAR